MAVRTPRRSEVSDWTYQLRWREKYSIGANPSWRFLLHESHRI